ncbi:MAG: DUF58 domain-containing protein [Bowdeniella nasicola]|nr:DUF58 domain-containing protein [Bowdeniella nasicola]
MRRSFAELSALRHRISLPIAKKAFGELEGAHQSLLTGSGEDFDDLAAYRPGDNVTRIDWKASARAGYPIIRRYLRQTNMSVMLAVDTGAAMQATSPSGESKAEIAADIIDVVAYLSHARSDACGLVTITDGEVEQLPARVGTHHVELLRHHARRALKTAGGDERLETVLARLDALVRRRSIIVIITDAYAFSDRAAAITKRLAVRHNVVMLQVSDIDPEQLAGCQVRDIQVGLYPHFVFRDAQVRAQLARELARRRAEVAERISHLAIPTTRVGGRDDIVPALERLVDVRAKGRAS